MALAGTNLQSSSFALVQVDGVSVPFRWVSTSLVVLSAPGRPDAATVPVRFSYNGADWTTTVALEYAGAVSVDVLCLHVWFADRQCVQSRHLHCVCMCICVCVCAHACTLRSAVTLRHS